MKRLLPYFACNKKYQTNIFLFLAVFLFLFSYANFAQKPQITCVNGALDFGPIEINGFNLEGTTTVIIDNKIANSFTIISPTKIIAARNDIFYLPGKVYSLKLYTTNDSTDYVFETPLSENITSFTPTTRIGPGDTLIINGNFDINANYVLKAIDCNGSIFGVIGSNTKNQIIFPFIDAPCNHEKSRVMLARDELIGVCIDTPRNILNGLILDGTPIINEVSPTIAKAGDTVTISGKYLYIFNDPFVKFGNTDAKSVTSVSKNIIKAVVGNGSSGKITVTNTNDETQTYSGFIYGSAICPNGSTTFKSEIEGLNYQWKIKSDSGFIDLFDSPIFSGVNTHTLSITNAPTSYYGSQFRCFVDGNYSEPLTLQFTSAFTNATDSAWENTSNWSCGSLPDANTDVIIKSGNIIVSQNTTCRSLTVKPGANVTVQPGVTLTIVN